jgi:hypothetical protein
VHVKLALVLLAAYLWTGLLVLRAARRFRHSDIYLRIFNEISVLGVIAILCRGGQAVLTAMPRRPAADLAHWRRSWSPDGAAG